MSKYIKLADCKEKLTRYYYCLSDYSQGFCYAFNEVGLRNILTCQYNISSFIDMDKPEIEYFDSCNDMFKNFENMFKKHNEHSHLQIYVAIEDSETGPVLIIIIGGWNIVFNKEKEIFVSYPGTYLDQIVTEPDACVYLKKYYDMSEALEDPALFNYRDVLDSI